MSPGDRRTAIVDATLAVMLKKGLAATTVRDVAAEMGTSSGLIHHYFDSMDELLATAFAKAATADLELARQEMADADGPVQRVRAFFGTYSRADEDWAMQLWLDAWAEAGRRPVVQETSQRLNVAWQLLLAGAIDEGLEAGLFTCPDPGGAAWRIVSMLDGLALQTVAHHVSIDRAEVVAWSMALTERELGLAPGTL